MNIRLPSIPWARVRQRAGGVAFALVLNAMLLLALFTLSPQVDPKTEDSALVTFDIAPAKKAEKEKAHAEKSPERRKERQAASAAPPAIAPPEPVKKPTEQLPSPFITLDSRQMASADIGKMTSKGPGTSGEGDRTAVAGPGEGPGGAQLYPVKWYREPTDAELSPFLPANAPGTGWGEVACKMIEHYHVENCQTIGESPLGSGYARAVRLASWQFLVQPPRVNGKPMIGTWVRIRIDYTRTAKAP